MDNPNEIEKLGCKLSEAICCTLTLVENKPIFECKHGIRFMRHIVISLNPAQLAEIHTKNISKMY